MTNGLQPLFDRLTTLVGTPGAMPPAVKTAVTAFVEEATNDLSTAITTLKGILAMPEVRKCSGATIQQLKLGVHLLGG